MKYCPSCGEAVRSTMKFCSECGIDLYNPDYKPIQEELQDSRSRTVSIERADPTYYSNDKGVRVTVTRFINGSTTYSMANITSVRRTKINPTIWPAVLLTLVGIATFFFGNDYIWIGVVLIVIAILWLKLAKPTYKVRITSAAGEEEPLEDKSKKYIDTVVTAINEAIIARK